MINYNELLYFTGQAIKTKFKNCDLICTKNKEDINKPTFYVEVRPLSSNSYKGYIDKLVNITITYTDKKVNNEKLNNILNDLESVFDLGIKVKGTFLMFKNKNYSFSEDGDFLNVNLTISYKDNKDVEDENDFYSEMLEELYMDFEMN